MHFYLYLTVVCLCHRYKILEIILYLIIGVCPAAVAFMMVCKFRTFLSCKSVPYIELSVRQFLNLFQKLQQNYKIIFHWIFFSSVSFQREPSGIYELFLGGLSFITGVIFFKSDGVIPFAHAIWHLFVLVGTMFHFYAINLYLLGQEVDEIMMTK